jgi:hypothetical protein
MPYRTSENKIEGVVLTVLEVERQDSPPAAPAKSRR